MTLYGRKPPGNKDFSKVRRSGGNGHGRPPGGPGERAQGNPGGPASPARQVEIRELVAAVRALPDVRFDKVEAIRKAIESGTYVVDARKVAQKMIDEIR